jgi:S-DNA-T family DNA segregation ATPase FtsK/SpoIIIE
MKGVPVRLLVSTIDPASPSPACQDLLLDAGPDATLAQVVPHLPRCLAAGMDSTKGQQPDTIVTVDGRPVAPNTMIGSPPLLRGAVLALGDDPGHRAQSGPRSALRLHLVGGPGAGRVLALRRGANVVGRAAGCEVRIDDAAVSRSHLEIHVDGTGVTVRELRPTNRTRINGVIVPPEGAPLRPDDRLALGSTTLVLRHDRSTPAATTTGDGMVRVHRRPRFTVPEPVARVTFPEPPTKPDRTRLPLIAALVPVVLSVVLALVLDSAAMMVFALLTPAMLIGQWWSDRRHGRVSYRRQLRAHATATAAAEERLTAALTDEIARRHLDHPDLAHVGHLAARVDAQLWQRRPEHDDYLCVRVGTADQPPHTTVEGSRAEELPRLTVEGSRAEELPRLESVPAVVDLGEVGVLGIAGPRARAAAVAAGLVAQLAAWHSPQDLRIVVFTTDPAGERTWRWATWLPHLSPLVPDSCITAVAAAEHEAFGRRLAELTALLDRRRAARTDSRVRPLPDIVVVLDGAEELRRRPGVPELLRDGPALGIRAICVDDDPQGLPVEARAQLTINSLPEPRADLDLPSQRIESVVPDLPSPEWAERFGRAMAPLEDATPRESAETVPDRVDFMAMHREAPGSCDPVDAAAIGRLWTGPASTTVHALLGSSAEGPVSIDLVRDGPHALIGGTTGAGKSELLQTLVTSLALAHRPDTLNFVLIDYKGGSAFTDCARLPHVLGVVTDLDVHLTSRALTSLEAELKRREHLLAAVGAKDLDDYLRVSRPGAPPLGRLVLVVDEFKMLADDLPDFVAGLVRLAAIGRSLGVHLVLATQRPAGIISADMRANISLRIALRVRDRADSDDVIESPEAAAISDRTPGRALIRTGGGDLLTVQTAYAGGPTDDGGAARASQPIVWPLTWTDLGSPPPRRRSTTPDEQVGTALSGVVDAIAQAAADLAITAPASPWLPPLPAIVTLDDLTTRPYAAGPASAAPLSHATGMGSAAAPPRAAGPASTAAALPGRAGSGPAAAPPRPTRNGPGVAPPHVAGSSAALARHEGPTGDDAVPIGLVDRPGSQLQEPYTWSLERDGHLGLAGGARTGRSTALHTIALALAHRHSPTHLHLHVLEGTPGSLATLAALPHVGSVSGPDDPVRTRRVVARLLDQLGSRRGAAHTVVLIDGWESLTEALDDFDQGELTDNLLRLLRDGLSAGVRVVVSGGRSVATGRLAGLLQSRLVLDMPDPLDLALAGISPSAAAVRRPPGRAYDVRDEAEVQLAIADDGTEELTRRWGSPPDGAGPWRVMPLPEVVDSDRVPAGGPDSLLVGLGGDDLAPLGYDLTRDERRIVVAGPPRSGRSTALGTVASRLLAAGRVVTVIATRRSPLTEWVGGPSLHVLHPGEVDRFIELRRAHPDLGIVVDDAEGLDGSPIETALVEATRLVDQAAGVVVIAVDSRHASAAFRGIVPEVARGGTGLLLQPTTPADGDLFRIRVEPSATRRPGRGLHVSDGVATGIQVALPSAALPTHVRP